MLPGRKKGQRLRRHRLSRSPKWAELWQIPLFCLGLISCAAATWTYRGNWSSKSSSLEQYEAMVDSLDHTNPESYQRFLQGIQSGSHTSGLSDVDQKYLQGCVVLAEAMRRYPLPAQSKEAAEAYSRAKAVFDKLLDVHKDYQQPRLPYRMALATIGSVPLTPKTIEILEQSLESNFTDREAGYQLMVRLRLQLSPPDYAGALKSLDLLMSMIEASHQYPYRLQKAELLSKLQRWAEIQKATANISAESPEYPAALQWQALAAFQQKQWGEAARLWGSVSPRDLGPTALLYYGLCQRYLKNTTEAQRLWERLWREHLQSAESIPAQCYLAELALEQTRWHEAAMSIISILATHEPSNLPNSYLTVAEFGEKTRNIADQLIQLRRWDDLQQLGQAATRWSFNGQSDYWLSQAWHARAEASSASENAPGQSRNAYLLAADYAWKAAQKMPAGEKPALLLQAGQDALRARAYQQAQRALGELLTLKPDETLRPIVLIGLAESLQEQKQHVLALDRLQEALRIPGNHEAQARLRLAQLLLLDDKQSQEAGRQLEQAAALVTRPGSGPDARTACHRWAAYLYNAVVENKTNQVLQAIDACEKALKNACPHPEAAQTRYLLAELLLAEARPKSEILPVTVDHQILRKHAAQLWQACQCFQTAAEELKKPDTIIYSNQNKDAFVRFARFGQAECWYELGQLSVFAPPGVPSADLCWQRAGELYQSLSDSSSNRVDSLHAYLRLSWCQQKRGLFAEMGETLRDARQQLQEMRDDELTVPSRFSSLKRSQWEAMLQRADDLDRGHP